MTDRPVLYVVVCAAPPALRIGELVELLMADGWTVCVIATPTAATWIDTDALAEQTGYPVRHRWRLPGEPDVLPKADAMVVAPATFNTINKWALGTSDTLALGILNEALGSNLPILTYPCAKTTLTAHPAYDTHLRLLGQAGVRFSSEEAFQTAEKPLWENVRGEVGTLRSTRSAGPGGDLPQNDFVRRSRPAD